MNEQFVRDIYYYKDFYLEFFETLKPDVKKKFNWTFSFFDEGRLIILLNGFQKKTQKTPKNEIELAEKLKKQYLNEKSEK
jgi:hypothetical protein